MSFVPVQVGSEIADNDRVASQNFATATATLYTLEDLVRELANCPPPHVPTNHLKNMLTTSTRLADFLGRRIDEATLVEVMELRCDFRSFLQARKYRPQTIATYVASMGRLLDCATRLGWDPADSLPAAWRTIFLKAQNKRVRALIIHLARIRRTPSEVTELDTDEWVNSMIGKGWSLVNERHVKTLFWRLMRDSGLAGEIPSFLKRETKYGIRLEDFPPSLKKEVKDLLDWKQAQFAPGRPKGGKIRPVSAAGRQEFLSGLYGFAVSVLGRTDIFSLAQLIDRELLTSFAEWYINERGGKGTSVFHRVAGLFGAVRHYPPLKKLEKAWFSDFLHTIPTDGDQDTLEERKNRHYLDYDDVVTIPDQLRQERLNSENVSDGDLAVMAMEESFLRFLCTLAWRQRNLRECRIGGPKPNLYKGPIPPNAAITKSDWVKQEEQQNPSAEFWQFRFSKEETKTKVHVHAVLPHQLIAPLEEYLLAYRPQLTRERDPGTLFVKGNGSPLAQQEVEVIVETLTARYRGVRVNPHHFRDIFAYAWLKDHPEDFLRLSKMLWHKNVDTTLKRYAARFNESTAVCALETWLDRRAA